jgi:hypothetical protein
MGGQYVYKPGVQPWNTQLHHEQETLCHTNITSYQGLFLFHRSHLDLLQIILTKSYFCALG